MIWLHRWQLPEAANAVSASTANESRQDRYATHVNPEKLKAAGEGLAHGTFHWLHSVLYIFLIFHRFVLSFIVNCKCFKQFSIFVDR